MVAIACPASWIAALFIEPNHQSVVRQESGVCCLGAYKVPLIIDEVWIETPIKIVLALDRPAMPFAEGHHATIGDILRLELLDQRIVNQQNTPLHAPRNRPRKCTTFEHRPANSVTFPSVISRVPMHGFPGDAVNQLIVQADKNFLVSDGFDNADAVTLDGYTFVGFGPAR